MKPTTIPQSASDTDSTVIRVAPQPVVAIIEEDCDEWREARDFDSLFDRDHWDEGMVKL